MPKFKPKTILIRVLRGKTRQIGDAREYCSSAGIDCYRDDDDGNSMISIATMETVDDQPGTGRSIDTYMYQPAGRWIERLAMRFTIASLHPVRIAQYIEADYTNFAPYFFDKWPSSSNEVVAALCVSHRNGSTVVAGLKGLVKQTQYVPLLLRGRKK